MKQIERSTEKKAMMTTKEEQRKREEYEIDSRREDEGRENDKKTGKTK